MTYIVRHTMSDGCHVYWTGSMWATDLWRARLFPNEYSAEYIAGKFELSQVSHVREDRAEEDHAIQMAIREIR